MFRYALVAALTVVAVVVVACTTNPATGKKILNFMPVEQEIRLGSEAAPQFLNEYGGNVPSQDVVQYVRQLGKRIAASSERPELPWEFHVPNSPVINAFALPGGKVFVTRGMMVKLDNEAQLAGVLGHEVGHVTAQHVNQRMSQAMVVQGIAVGVGVAGEAADSDWLRVLGVGAGVGGTGYLLKFSRDQESEADALGVRYMTQQGYNPYGQVQVMKVLAAASGDTRMWEVLATHPHPETRIDRLNSLIAQQYPNARGANNPYTFAKDNYHQKALAPLRQLPPAPAPKQAMLHDADLHVAMSWCGVCQHEHQP